MKKLLLVLLALLVSLSLICCGIDKEESTPESKPESVESIPESLPESKPESTPESVTESVLESTPESTPEPIVTYVVTFVQEGCDDIEITVNEGEGIAEVDIPTPAPVKGHTVGWDVADFSNITSNMTVTAIPTPNDYTITYVVRESGITAPAAQTVTFGDEFTLATVSGMGLEFKHWALEDGTPFVSGTYELDENVTVYAVFSSTTGSY